MKIPCKGMYIRVCDGSGTSLKQTPDHPCDTHYLFGGYHAKIIDKKHRHAFCRRDRHVGSVTVRSLFTRRQYAGLRGGARVRHYDD